MPLNRSRSSSLFFALCAAGSAACILGVTDSSTRHSRVVLDVGSLLAAQLSGDFVTVADTARLTISSGGSQSTQTRVLGPGEFETDFDVVVKSGPATFGIDVISTNGTRLYTGETSATIDADGFAVTVTPHAVTAVLVVSPAHPTYTMDADFPDRFFTATLQVRNPGSSTLTWNVDSAASVSAGVRIFCNVPSTQENCLHSVAWASAREQPITVGFTTPFNATAPPPQGIKFLSSVGSTIAAKAP